MVLILICDLGGSVVAFLVLTRLKVPGRGRTDSRTRTATRTSSKTAARCSVGRHTQGNVSLISAGSVHVTDFTMFTLYKYEDMMQPVKCFVLLCSVLDRRGVTRDELPGPTTPVVPGLTTDPAPQTTVRMQKDSVCTGSQLPKSQIMGKKIMLTMSSTLNMFL